MIVMVADDYPQALACGSVVNKRLHLGTGGGQFVCEARSFEIHTGIHGRVRGAKPHSAS